MQVLSITPPQLLVGSVGFLFLFFVLLRAPIIMYFTFDKQSNVVPNKAC